ncbi:hsp70-binding protein 1 [Coccinella septempunctata]|uniref:hsp70-binding protein 1 n=1 Tax=Coccinella septempunctata TaxID=41139 RepID=UPI001D0943A5|nr:hsp70-binding protein 1 [Coccinella septempunctata]
MPGVQESNEGPKAPIGAICAAPQPTSSNNTSNASIPQPRQPNSLQGLLRYAMSATENGSTETKFLPMDEERKKFLETALKSMTINVVEVLQKQIEILMKVDTVKDGDDVSNYLEALENIMDYIDNIDIANDFHKIGGFMILKPCLNCKNAEVRSAVCGLIAELCQNNPYCQKIVIDHEFVPILLHILDNDQEDIVGVKCIYALSAIARDNSEGFSQLVRYGGLNILLRTLNKEDDKFRIKTAFLLSSLCRSQPDLKSRLIFLEIIPILINLISKERKPSSEHILSLLLSLVEDNATALNECRNPEHNFKEILQNYISKVENKEECQEEEEYCKRLMHLIFV